MSRRFLELAAQRRPLLPRRLRLTLTLALGAWQSDDPMFVNACNGELSLQSGCLAIDAGDTTQ